MIHVIYISGLGDRYDFVRKAGLWFWKRKNRVVTHIPMRWLDPKETFEQKLTRISQAISSYPDANVVLVGESAGGAVAIACLRGFRDQISHVITLCGMNQGAGNVNPALYGKNPAFHDAMERTDTVVQSLTPAEKEKLFVVYSSGDFTVRPKNSLIEGTASYDLKIFGHMQSILAVLYWRYKRILKKI